MTYFPHFTFAIGDIHGERELLENAFEAIEAWAKGRAFRIITLGDYIDRGPDSAGVIALLRQREAQGRLVCLKGNHETMMLKACDTGRTGHWIRNGGERTLMSYDGEVLRDDLDWLRRLPFVFADRHRIFVHGGLEPGIALCDQQEESCLWIRDAFLKAPAEALPAHVVHGHTEKWAGKPDPAEPEQLPHRTNLDTGAYYTGRLTIGVFETFRPGGPVDVIHISRPQRPKSRINSVQDAIAQSIRFNHLHRIGEKEKILFGYRDGGRSTGFDGAGNALTPYREVMIVEDPAIDPPLQQVITQARDLVRGLSEYKAIDTLADFVADTLKINDDAENEKILADVDGSGELRGQKITLGQMITAGTGVCRHRSLLFKVLADDLGIATALVRGNYDSPQGSGGHAWNEVVTSSGERLVVDVMHRMSSDVRDGYFASYGTVTGDTIYPEAGTPVQTDSQGVPPVDNHTRLLAKQRWIAATSPMGGKSGYAFADELSLPERQALEAALTHSDIHYDEYATTLGSNSTGRRPVIRVRGLGRLLLERTGVRLQGLEQTPADAQQ
jgi:serine/threonine protein phosphatase 1